MQLAEPSTYGVRSTGGVVPHHCDAYDISLAELAFSISCSIAVG